MCRCCCGQWHRSSVRRIHESTRLLGLVGLAAWRSLSSALLCCMSRTNTIIVFNFWWERTLCGERGREALLLSCLFCVADKHGLAEIAPARAAERSPQRARMLAEFVWRGPIILLQCSASTSRTRTKITLKSNTFQTIWQIFGESTRHAGRVCLAQIYCKQSNAHTA